jgi:hypothetical protein
VKAECYCRSRDFLFNVLRSPSTLKCNAVQCSVLLALSPSSSSPLVHLVMLTLHFIPSTHFRPPLFILTPFHPIFCPERFLTYGTWQRTRRELTSWLCWTMWYHATLSRNTELSSSATQSSPAGKSILLSLSMSSRWWFVQSQRRLQRAISTTTSSYAHTSSLTSMPYYPSINVSISPHSSHLLLVFSEPLSTHCQALESKFLVTMETSTRKRGQCYLFKHTLLRSTPVHAVAAYYWDIGIRLRVTAGCDTSTPLLFSVTPYSMMSLQYLLHTSYTTERSQLFFPSHNIVLFSFILSFPPFSFYFPASSSLVYLFSPILSPSPDKQISISSVKANSNS